MFHARCVFLNLAGLRPVAEEESFPEQDGQSVEEAAGRGTFKLP